MNLLWNILNMLIKLTIIIAETSFRLYNKITTCNGSYSVYKFLNHIKDNEKKVINFDRLVKVQSGKSFTDLSSLDINSLNNMNCSELKHSFNAGK